MSRKKNQVERYSDSNRQVVSHEMLVSRQRIVSVSPLPPPSDLEKYENFYPGITKKFMDMTEKQQNHRMELEKTVITAGAHRMKLGQIFAFILGLTSILGGLLLLVLERNIAGFSVLIGATATLVGAFVYGRRINKAERVEKSNQNPPN